MPSPPAPCTERNGERARERDNTHTQNTKTHQHITLCSLSLNTPAPLTHPDLPSSLPLSLALQHTCGSAGGVWAEGLVGAGV
eukprot:547959-Rhodomonas_salina.1